MRSWGSPSTEWLGIEIASAGEGEAVLRMPARPEMANRADVVHGGFIALLADSAMGRAMSTVLPDGERHYSFDLKMSFISPGRIGEPLEAVGRVLHSGRRTGVADCRVTAGGGRLVATATASFIVALPVPSGSEA
ncbi:MAG TPA: PaaI family thioesterase [Candidatus Dormibacteraeota bacterium]|nr:PaaI family thioesterase [Candidatus Dormibacteraeota bacterium]